MTCLAGLHASANGPSRAADYLAAQVGRIEAVKLLSTHPPGDVDGYRQACGPGVFLLGRIYEDLGDRVVSPAEFAGWQAAPDSSMRRLVARGVRYWEVHNEPNLIQEGLGRSWNDGASFGRWFVEARRLLFLAFPDCLFGFPGLSPGGDVPGIRMDAGRFWQGALPAMQAADWIGAHAYEVGDPGRGAGGAWRIPHEMVPEKPLAITEFSSPMQTSAVQARQYRAFYESLRGEPGVFAAFCFVVYGDAFRGESWHDGAKLNEIPAEVARRMDKELEPLYTGTIDKIGANARDASGRWVSLIAPGTRVRVYSPPATIAGWEDRVLIGGGLNVYEARIIHDPPPTPPAVFAWPTEFRVVTQPFGARPEYYRQFGLAGHEGIDLRAPAGSKVFAAYDGVVSLVASGGNYGNQVRLKHQINGKTVTTVYAHLEKALVAPGDMVTKGQVIGLADTTGNAQGTHLHFGLKVDGEGLPGFGGYSNPAPWLGI